MLSTFMGRGTTQLHAALMNRRPIGNVSTLSIVLTRPRLAPPTLDEVARKLDQVPWGHGGDRRSRTDRDRILQSANTASHLREPMFVMINQQKFTETANCWGVQEQCEGNQHQPHHRCVGTNISQPMAWLIGWCRTL